MRRALLILGGLCTLTWVQFEIFPGHTYLQANTQIYVPMLEKLNSSGLLSRDLVATNPNLTYTIYDEATLFLQDAGKLDLHAALLSQQILFRGAAVLGVFLLALSTGLGAALALAVAAIANLAGMLPGPDVLLFDLEPTPRAFAFDLTILALGFIARSMPLLAGLAGGLALVYDPRVAAPFWMVIIAALLFDRKLRRMLRPGVTILAVFALLLANLSQLQPGVPDAHEMFEQISPVIAKIQQFRTGYVWVSTWALRDIWLYLGLWACELWATCKLWPSLNRQLRWLFCLLPALGIASVPLSYSLLEVAHWRLIPQIQPANTLIFLVSLSSITCAMAGLEAAAKRNWSLAAPFLLVVALLPLALPRPPRYRNEPEIANLASWAQQATWGGSMFLFPDAKRELYPGIFRALSNRAVWVDWETGKQAVYFDGFADEWARRWHDTMEGDFAKLQRRDLLLLPIDYYVLKREHAVTSVSAVFSTANFLVYDAHDLKTSPVWNSMQSSNPVRQAGCPWPIAKSACFDHPVPVVFRHAS